MIRWSRLSSRGSTWLRSAAAFHRSIQVGQPLGVLGGEVVAFGGVGGRVVEPATRRPAKSSLPSITSRSAAVSWLTWFVTAFQPSAYIARLPQHS